MFDEVHQDGVPGEVRNQKLFEETIGLVMAGFSSATSDTRLAVVYDKGSHFGPSILVRESCYGQGVWKVGDRACYGALGGGGHSDPEHKYDR